MLGPLCLDWPRAAIDTEAAQVEAVAMPTERGVRASLAEIEKFLKGIDFPASKQDLIQYAEDNNAPEHVIEVLNNMPDQQYGSAADVAKGIGSAE